MMSCIKKLGVLFILSAMVGAPIASALAQGAPAGFGASSYLVNYVGPHDAGGGHCAGLTWHISRVVQADKSLSLNGPIWYEDGSSTSWAKGTGQPDGNFMLNVTQMNGTGPVGTITGQRMPDGSISATAVGTACFAGTYNLAPGQTSAKM
jgi:hypothetical protein